MGDCRGRRGCGMLDAGALIPPALDPPQPEGEGMPFARVVSFEGVTRDRVAQLEREIGEGPPPEGLPATEILLLHDRDAEKALVAVFFDTEEDYATGDRILDAMPAADTPGRRTSVTRYEVALRRTV